MIRGRARSRAGRGALVAALAALTALGTAGCRRNDGPTEPSPVRSLSITVEQPQILVGGTTRATATPLDEDGKPVPDRVVTWASLTPGIVSITSVGDVTGLQGGIGQIRAATGSVSSSAIVIVTNPLAASIHLGRDTATLTVPGGSVQAIASVTDIAGRPLANPVITWTSSAPQVAAVNVAGLITAVASGSALITAAIDGLTATMAITVRPAAMPGAPTITSIVPPVLRPGGAYTVNGANFAPTPGGNQVLVEGLLASVQVATPTQLSIVLPTAGFTCEPGRDGFLQVTANARVGGISAPLQVGARHALEPGQSVVVVNHADVRCNELVPASGRWVVTVFNAHRGPVSPTSTGNVLFSVRGIAGPPAPPPAEAVVGPMDREPPPRGQSGDVAASLATHAAVLDWNLRELSLARRPGGALAAPGPPPAAQVGTVGGITPLKLPNLDAADPCVTFTTVGFRTVYAGPRVAIVEDTTTVWNGRATQAGQVDAYFTRLGSEFEAVMWPILSEHFGNALAMDAQLGGPGRVVMVFSPRVNTMQRGTLLGFVASCDLFPVAQRPSSNLGAFFYAVTPTSSNTGYASPDSRDQWLRVMRATIIHEVKHVTAFSERVSRGLPLEESAWEEGSARIAEELYARSLYRTAARTNTPYAPSLGCDIRYDQPAPPCADRPVLMLRHFDGLYSFMANPEINSPLGRAFTGDFTFYAGAWSFLRWAIDHFGPSEAQFLRDLVASPVTGTANIELRTGRRWEESLGEWSLAAYLDDIGGFAPVNGRLAMPSWNYPDMWLGMCSEMGPCIDPDNPVIVYLRSTPFAPRHRSFGNFAVGIGSMVGGGFTLLDLAGPGSSSQVIEVKSLLSDGDAPPNVRIAFARVR